MLTLPDLAQKLGVKLHVVYSRLTRWRRHNPDFGRKQGRDWVVTETEAAQLAQRRKAGRKPKNVTR